VYLSLNPLVRSVLLRVKGGMWKKWIRAEPAVDLSQPDGVFRHQVEIVVPVGPAARQMLMGWCIGKQYRTVPPHPQPGTKARWCFAIADDAEFFQSAFGGVIISVGKRGIIGRN